MGQYTLHSKVIYEYEAIVSWCSEVCSLGFLLVVFLSIMDAMYKVNVFVAPPQISFSYLVPDLIVEIGLNPALEMVPHCRKIPILVGHIFPYIKDQSSFEGGRKIVSRASCSATH